MNLKSFLLAVHSHLTDWTARRLKKVDLFQATCLVLADEPREPVNAIFFHAQTAGNEEGLFELVADLLSGGRARYVVLNGSRGERFGGTIPGEAWPGYDVYHGRLIAMGVSEDRIVRAGPGMHTFEEAEAFLLP